MLLRFLLFMIHNILSLFPAVILQVCRMGSVYMFSFNIPFWTVFWATGVSFVFLVLMVFGLQKGYLWLVFRSVRDSVVSFNCRDDGATYDVERVDFPLRVVFFLLIWGLLPFSSFVDFFLSFLFVLMCIRLSPPMFFNIFLFVKYQGLYRIVRKDVYRKVIYIYTSYNLEYTNVYEIGVKEVCKKEFVFSTDEDYFLDR